MITRGCTEWEALSWCYGEAKAFVVEAGFEEEIEWQRSRCLNEVSESDFLREAAWVVLSSGMRERVVRRKFPEVSTAFREWRSGYLIVQEAEICREEALKAFGSERKIDAILRIAGEVVQRGFSGVRGSLLREGVDYISRLPFMGPVTSLHLAKNLGLDVVKPDRHLVRLAAVAGYESPLELCEVIAAAVEERVSVVDLVLWRYLALGGDASLFADTFGSVGFAVKAEAEV